MRQRLQEDKPALHALPPFWRDGALLQNEAAIKPRLSGLKDAIGFFRPLIKRHAFNAGHGHAFFLGPIDLALNFLLHLGDVVGRANNFHALCRMVDEAVERHHREDRADGFRCRRVVDPEQAAELGFTRHRVGGEVRVGDHQVVAMAHGAQRVEYIRIQQWIDIFKHLKAPLIHLKYWIYVSQTLIVLAQLILFSIGNPDIFNLNRMA